MNGLSIWHWLVLIVVVVVLVWPVAKILRRAGFSGWWSILMFVPIANYVALWVFALARWPMLEKSRDSN
jgi:hypothetical protein